MKEQKIELPPLRSRPPSGNLRYTRKEIQDYARTAIEPYAKRIAELEADRQRRGEPVAVCVVADRTHLRKTEQQDGKFTYTPDDSVFACKLIRGEGMLEGAKFYAYLTPRPAEPVNPNEGYKPEYKYCEDGKVVWTNAADAPVVKSADPVKCQSADMGKHACTDRQQCWEPCGELGSSVKHAKVAEPVKVPSNEDIFNELQDHGALTTINTVNAVRALLARYDQPAQPAAPTWEALHHAWIKVGADVAGLDWGAFAHAVHYAPVAAQPTVPDGLIAALRNQRQIDRHGSEVAVSRQAVDEAADLLDKLATPPADERAQQEADKTTPEEDEAWRELEKKNGSTL